MTRSEFVGQIARKAEISRAAAERVAVALFDGADPLAVRAQHALTRTRRRDGSARPAIVDENGEITLSEAAFRRRLVEGVRRLRGMEIEELYPSGWADETIRP